MMILAEPKPIHIGDHFGYWTVIGLDDGLPEHRYKALCRCVCGTVRWISRSRLRHGRAKSCGCKNHPLVDYGIHPGDKIGYWTILRQDRKYFICRCICGKERKVPVYRLMSGESLSCGCKKYQGRQEEIKAAMKRGADLRDELSQSNLAVKYAGFGRQQNRNSTTGTTGVSKTRNGKYRAYIMVDRKQISLGTFADIEDAISARKEAEQRYFADRQEAADKIKASFRGEKPDTKGPRH
jgi:hypothetical protein